MGKRGPKPKPSAVHQRQGTYRADRRPGEITPEKGKLRAPRWLSKAAKKHWRLLAPLLEREGLLTALDEPACGLLSEAFAEWLEARAIVEESARADMARAGESGKGEGVGDAQSADAPISQSPNPPISTKFLTVTDKGNIIQHPGVGVANRAWEKIVKLLREFGMTPSARAGLAIAGRAAPEDPMTKLLRDIAAGRGRGPVESN